MKQLLFCLITAMLMFINEQISAQVAVNTDGSTYDVSAMLDVKSSTKGFLPPRVALTAVNVAAPVTTPATGLLVYNTAFAGTPPNNVFPGNYFWNGTKWIPVTAPQGANAGDMLYWNGTQWVGVPVGTTGQMLILNGSVPTWGQGTITLPTVTTNPVSNLSSVSAVCGGNITDGGSPVTARGVCWSTTANPTIGDQKTTDGVGSGAFTSNITGLNPNTLYHVRAYATNSVGTTYGNDVTFTTINIVTTAVSAITATTATSGGTIASDGGNPITARGVCWNTMTAPTLANSFTTNGSGTGSFTSNLTSLTGNTMYYVRAYITNGSGTFYGNEVTFFTSPVVPVVTNTDTSNVTKTTAMSGGTVTNDGGLPVTARGVCWSTSSNPTIANSKTIDGSGLGSFTSYLTGLAEYTTYYFRAYATNSAGTGYGWNWWFKTKGTLPTVTTDEISGITATTAIALGTVTAAGNPSVSERGFCWKTTPNPTINNSKVACGSGAGGFNGTLTKLAPNTTYHVRAYATSAIGTSYGADITFLTLNSYYEGFENGFPSTWSGIGWGVTTTGTPYEGYFCLLANQVGDSIQFTRTVTTSPNGNISFFYNSDCYWCHGGENTVSFYIDNVLQSSFSEFSNWALHSYSFPSGTHTFKWKCINVSVNPNVFIDYIIVSP